MDMSKIWAKENTTFTKRILNKMEGDKFLPEILDLIDNQVVNIWIVLAYLAKVLKPECYAELGVRRGFSMAIVGGRQKTANLLGFDNWQVGYGGTANPGPDFVKSELLKVGHTGEVELITGNCDVTVPAYDSPLLFPLILADAEHTVKGVCRDIQNCRRLLEPGGYLVIDDLQDSEVMKAWQMALADIGTWTWQRDRVGIIRNE